ncbi:MAG: thioredoxin domain-containing protein [Clostridium sp.]|nr:thioredoxin domain-containing protein [Clostridium sp.]
MKKIRAIMCLAFASVMMACGAGNTSAKADAEASVETQDTKSQAGKAEDSSILKPKSDAQIRPGMKVLRPTVIDFNATWCGPCRLFTPAFDKAAEKYSSKVDFYSIDTDQYPQTATAFSIRAIPTIVFMMPDGTVQTHVGLNDFLTTLTNENASQQEVEAAMSAELERMVADMLK